MAAELQMHDNRKPGHGSERALQMRAAQLARFLVVGGIATALQYAILILGVQALGWRAPWASAVGYAISCVLNYWMNYRFTFRSSRAHSSAALRFGLVVAGGLAINTAVMWLLVEGWHAQYLLSQVAATAAALVWNFGGSALWSFAAPRDA
jgi:putative flippase GtrA